MENTNNGGIFDNITNDVYLNTKLYIRYNNYVKFDMKNSNVFVNEDMVIERVALNGIERYLVLLPSPVEQGVSDYFIGQFQFDIIQSFNHTNTTSESFEHIQKKYSNPQNDKLFNLYSTEVRRCLALGFLYI